MSTTDQTPPTQPDAGTPTPRTDAHEFEVELGAPCVSADFARQLERELTSTQQALAEARAAGGFCEKHRPNGGHRNCLVCACERLTFALSRISGLCSNPDYPDYDTHYSEDEVVKQVATLRQQNEALRRDGERIDKLERTCLFTQPHMSPNYLKGTVAIDILTRHGNLRAAIDDVLPRDNINVTYSPRAAQQAEGKP